MKNAFLQTPITEATVRTEGLMAGLAQPTKVKL